MRWTWLPLLVAGVGVGAFVSCDDSGETGGGGSGAAATGSGVGGANCSGGSNAGTGAFDAICTDCHGTGTNPAPPPDTLGNTDDTLPSVGAHPSHFGPSDWHKSIGCGECHPVPSEQPDPCVPSHENNSVEIEWGPVAQQGSYDTVSNVCSNVYCHGGTLEPDGVGTTVRAPEWTKCDGTQCGCGLSCHTLPPGGTHDTRNDCESCHPEVMGTFNAGTPADSVWADPSLHIDGIHQYVGGSGVGGGGATGGAAAGGSGGAGGG